MFRKRPKGSTGPSQETWASAGQALAQAELLPIHPAPLWLWWSITLLVAAAAVLTYWPTLQNEFVSWDDKDYLIKNEQLTKKGGLGEIWNPSAEQRQYYPLVFTSFWLEHRFELARQAAEEKRNPWTIPPEKQKWDPAIYHGTNLVLHAINAGLVVWLLRLLGLGPWVAWFVAALFAVHPINVASVAWAAERKNVLSGLFYLLALIFWIRSTRRQSLLQYTVCMAFFIMALLSKTAMATLPATAIICDRLILRRWTLQSFALTAPMFALGLIGILITRNIEQVNARATNPEVLEPIKRPLAAAGAVYFYVYKIIVPHNFIPVYPRWEITANAGSLSLFLAALISLPLIALGLWRIRRKIPDHLLWGLAMYIFTIGPMLGLVAFNYMQFAFVADHFVYLASLGLFVALAVTLWNLLPKMGESPQVYLPVTAAACAILVALASISFFYNRDVWQNSKTFWKFTTEKNPNCWPGHYNLANVYNSEGKQMEAVRSFQRAAATKPGLYQAHRSAAEMLWSLGEWEAAIKEYQHVVQAKPQHKDFRMRFGMMLEKCGRDDEAEQQFRELVRLNPDYAMGHLKLAETLRGRMRFEQAIAEYKKALEINPNLSAARAGLQATERARASILDGS